MMMVIAVVKGDAGDGNGVVMAMAMVVMMMMMARWDSRDGGVHLDQHEIDCRVRVPLARDRSLAVAATQSQTISQSTEAAARYIRAPVGHVRLIAVTDQATATIRRRRRMRYYAVTECDGVMVMP